MKDMALKVLDGFKEGGFWTATEQEDGTFKMTNTKITNEQYKTLKAVLGTLNNNGYTSSDQAKQREEYMKNRNSVVK